MALCSSADGWDHEGRQGKAGQLQPRLERRNVGAAQHAEYEEYEESQGGESENHETEEQKRMPAATRPCRSFGGL